MTDGEDPAVPTDPEDAYDVAVVGGGPAGGTAGVFTARGELDTVVFDRGRSSLRRCAFLENFPGFPAGVDVETFYDLLHEQATEAGCDVVPELVTDVERTDDGFRIETDAGRTVETSRVVAATKYGAPYLHELDAPALFVNPPAEGGERDDGDSVDPELDPDCVDADGRTPVEGLYVAGPLGGAGDQAVIAAGDGASVGRTVVADARREAGYWEAIATPFDWVRRDAELGAEWRDRGRWREWFASHEPEDLADDEVAAIREEYVDRRFDRYLEAEAIAERRRRGQRRLAANLDDEVLIDAVADETLLDAVADETLLDAVAERFDEAVRPAAADGVTTGGDAE